MKWLSRALIVAIFAPGCGSTQPTVNPFLGPTTVPPPGTGEAVMPSVSVPYYQSAPPPGAAPNYSAPQYQTPQYQTPQYQTPQYSLPGGAGSSVNPADAVGNVAFSNEQALRAEQGVVRLDEAYANSANVAASAQQQFGNQFASNEPAFSIPSDAQPLVLNRRVEPPPVAAPPAIAASPQFDRSQPLQLAAAQQPLIQQQRAWPLPSTPSLVQPSPSTFVPQPVQQQPLAAQQQPAYTQQPTQQVPPAYVQQTVPQQVFPQQGFVPQQFVQNGCDPCACQPTSFTASYGQEITDLPAYGSTQAAADMQARTAAARQPTLAVPQSGVVLASGVQQERAVVQAGFQPAGTASDANSARYGYDTSYSWVRGKLEYSSGTGQWKLRYIPIDGDTDQFGGSVVIANPELLGGLQPSEYVTLRGGVVSLSDPNSTFAPVYKIQQTDAVSAS